jgi:hypothetical protein
VNVWVRDMGINGAKRDEVGGKRDERTIEGGRDLNLCECLCIHMCFCWFVCANVWVSGHSGLFEKSNC